MCRSEIEHTPIHLVLSFIEKTTLGELASSHKELFVDDKHVVDIWGGQKVVQHEHGI